jgi:4-amino-4-deoxy-L-arabinose transferase-like glycosyltransferase
MIEMRRSRVVWNSFTILTAVLGFITLVFFLNPYPVIKAWVDSFVPDGSLESLTPALFSTTRLIFLPLGLVSLLASTVLLRSRHRSEKILADFSTSLKNFSAERVSETERLVAWMQGIFEGSSYQISLLVITATGILYRAMDLLKPVSHDEAYTFMAFASRGLWHVITDYHLPNNHVFHSVLVMISSTLLGSEPWAIRMPAFIAGTLLIPVTYMVARIFYDKQVALVSAAWVASAPVLIGYASNARGYSLVSLFTLLIIALGVYVKEKKSLVGWTIFVILAALGFYTLPTMLYPFGAMMTWMFLSVIFDQVSEDYREGSKVQFVLKYLVPVSAAVLFLVIVLYSPIFWKSGIQSVVGNGFVAPMGWSEFIESIQVRVINTWKEWNTEVHPLGSILLIFGIGVSSLGAIIDKPTRVPLGIPAFLWIGSVLVIQRVAPWPRVWIFLLPLVLTISAAGLLAAAKLIRTRISAGDGVVNIIFAGCLLVPLAASLATSLQDYSNSRAKPGNIEEAAIFLSDFIDPEDVILVTAPDAVTLRYYLKQYEVDGQQSAYQRDQEYRRALVVVNQRYGQTLDSVLESRGSTAEIEIGLPNIVYQKGNILVYEILLAKESGG